MAESTPVTLFSPLGPIALAKRLKKEMDERAKKSGFMVHGGGTEKEMRLVYGRRKVSFGVEPKLKATMREYQGGTLIEGDLHEAGDKKPLMIIWFSFVSMFFVGTLILWKIDEAPFLFNIFFTGVPAIMLFAFSMMVFKTRNDSKADRGTPQKIVEFLAETVDAKPLQR